MNFLTAGIFFLALGLSGLIWVIFSSIKIRRLDNEHEKYDSTELNKKLQAVSKFHMVSIFCAFVGLILIVLGFFFD